MELNWLPSFGRGEVIDLGWWTTGCITMSGLKSLMPSITLGLYQMTLVMRLTRAEMLEVLKQDYIRLAYSLGLTNKQIYFFRVAKYTYSCNHDCWTSVRFSDRICYYY